MLGPDPTPLDRLLVRRVVNGWVAVHVLELELAIHPPADPRAAVPALLEVAAQTLAGHEAPAGGSSH